MGGDVSAAWRWVALAATLLEAVTVAVHLQDVNVVSQAIEQSAGEPFEQQEQKRTSKNYGLNPSRHLPSSC